MYGANTTSFMWLCWYREKPTKMYWLLVVVMTWPQKNAHCEETWNKKLCAICNEKIIWDVFYDQFHIMNHKLYICLIFKNI
jgi:hypothetical protein